METSAFDKLIARKKKIVELKLIAELAPGKHLKVRVRQLRLDEYMRNRYGDFGGLQIWKDIISGDEPEPKKMTPAELLDYYTWARAIARCAVLQINNLDEDGNEIWMDVEFVDEGAASRREGDKCFLTISGFDFDDNVERVAGWALQNLNNGPDPPATFPSKGLDNLRNDGEDVRDATARIPDVGARHTGSNDRVVASSLGHSSNESDAGRTGGATSNSRQTVIEHLEEELRKARLGSSTTTEPFTES